MKDWVSFGPVVGAPDPKSSGGWSSSVASRCLPRIYYARPPTKKTRFPKDRTGSSHRILRFARRKQLLYKKSYFFAQKIDDSLGGDVDPSGK